MWSYTKGLERLQFLFADNSRWKVVPKHQCHYYLTSGNLEYLWILVQCWDISPKAMNVNLMCSNKSQEITKDSRIYSLRVNLMDRSGPTDQKNRPCKSKGNGKYTQEKKNNTEKHKFPILVRSPSTWTPNKHRNQCLNFLLKEQIHSQLN